MKKTVIAGLAALLTGCTSSIEGQPVFPSTPFVTASPPPSTITVSLAAPPPTWQACSLVTADEVAWVVDSPRSVEGKEQAVKRKATGFVTYNCHYHTKGEPQAFAALTVLFAPNAGGQEAAALDGATKNWTNVQPVSGVGDLAATYRDPKSPDKRFIFSTKRLGKDSVAIYFNANTPIPDEVAPKLPDLARKVLAQLK